MSRIASAFKPGRKALIAYVTVGYPDIEATLKVVPALAKAGCDIVELGIPFSDPLADGVTIQNSSYQALQNGVTPEVCLETAKKLRQQVDIPLLFMTYFNPVLSYGIDKFCTACGKAGIDGMIIPDLPPEEGLKLEQSTRACDLDLVYLLAPTSTQERIKLVADRSHGFIYLVSVTGVTGARTDLPTDLADFVGRVRKTAKQPLCVGFGISTPAQAKQVAAVADGIIVGSQIIRLMEKDRTLGEVSTFVKSLRKAIDSI
jgi:tryptophan synthase alpha chain